MNESVLKYLRELSSETKERVTNHFFVEVEEFSLLTAKIIETLQRYSSQHPVHNERDSKQVAYSLMSKGANTLMAGFELALTGYRWEPPVLFRNALEGFATAWDIVHSENRFATWKAGKKFDSTDCISNLTKTIKPVGKMYGFLSNMCVHTSPLNSSPAMLVFETGPEFQFFGLTPTGKENIRKGEIYFALLSAYVCLQLTELVFHNFSMGLETIEKIPGADFAKNKVSSRHQQFVDAAIQHFKSMSEDPTTCF